MNIKQLQEQRGDKLTQLKSLATVIGEGKASDEQRSAFDSLENEVRGLTADIERIQRSQQFQTPDTHLEAAAQKDFSFLRMVQALDAGRPLDGAEREMVEASQAQARSLGIATKGLYLSSDVLNGWAGMRNCLPVGHEKRTMSVGSSTAGGNWIPTDKVGFFDALYAWTACDKLGAEFITGLAANTDLIGFSTGVTVGWATETADASAGDPTTASRSLTPKRLTAYVDFSKMLLTQTNESIERNLLTSMLKASATKLDAGVIAGASNGPTGLINTSGIGSVAIGTNGGAPTLAKILEIVQVTQTANAGMNGKFLINPKTEAKLKQVSIDSGSGAMLMSYMSYFGGVQKQIDGYPTVVSQNVPSNLDKGTSTGVCSAIVFGDWDNCVIGQFGGLDVVVDPYSQAIGGKTRIVLNQFYNSVLKQPAAFTACLDVTTT